MAFDHNRRAGSHSGGDSFWTSYSDLFLGLSTIFLLLYVTASLRTGTDAIKSQVDNQKLSMQVDELRSQLKMYEQVKADYLNKDASKDELQEYKELMDKLTFLKEDAKSDKERLAMESLENDKKAQALTKYQQMVRNIINANKVAKTKIINRNTVIDDQDQTIDQQKTDITNLATDVEQKKAEISEQNRKIASAKQALDKNKKRLMAAFKEKQITKRQLEEKTRKLQAESQRKIQEMQAVNKNYSQQLNKMSSELQNTQQALSGTQQALSGTQQALAGTKQELSGTQAALQQKAQEANAARGEANAARGEAEGLKGKVAGLSGKLKDTEGALGKAREEMDARREIAREIKKGFQAAGVKADVDMQTGEVVLDFGDSYFDSGSSNLKPKMIDVIERAMPAYSKSLFGNAKIANKISTVEVVGFASPTYKGRYVDPRSNKPDDKAALKYNMDLSYRRANSIFNYMVNNKDGSFEHQQDLLSLMKVSGRSFLEVMKLQGRSPATAAEFCKVNDCKKAQKVIVRFSMDGKK